MPPLPALEKLHERHRGLVQEVAAYYALAAAVCLSKHHIAPVPVRVSAEQRADAEYLATWPAVTLDQIGAMDNDDDATRDGAYAVVLAAAEAHLGLVAIRRAKQKTGCDYYVAPAANACAKDPELNLEDAVRLEVSGIDRGNESEVRTRLRQKVEQAMAGKSNLPAMAGVVAFSSRRIAFREAK